MAKAKQFTKALRSVGSEHSGPSQAGDRHAIQQPAMPVSAVRGGAVDDANDEHEAALTAGVEALQAQGYRVHPVGREGGSAPWTVRCPASSPPACPASNAPPRGRSEDHPATACKDRRMSQQALAAFPDPLLPVGRQAFQAHRVNGDVGSGEFRFRHGLKQILFRQAIHGEVDIGSPAKPPVDGRTEQPHAIDRRPAVLQGLGAADGRRQGPPQTTRASLALPSLALPSCQWRRWASDTLIQSI